MGAYRDEQLFAELSARQHGYDDGYENGEILIAAGVAETLGITSEQVRDLCGRDISQRLVAMTALATTIETTLSIERQRHAMYVSHDPSIVARIIIDEQTDFAAEDTHGKELHDPLAYDFVLNDEGAYQARTMPLPHHYLESHDLNADWVGSRLAILGVERDKSFCAAIADQIVQTMLAGEADG